MNFLSPLNLLWSVPLIGGIVALWMLKMRRKDRVVSSLFLWRDVTPAIRADTPFQRLQSNLLLILQIVAALLMIFALAGPSVLAKRTAGHSYVLVIDSSASMSATDVSSSRIEVAKSLAAQFILDRVKGGDRVALIDSGSPVSVVSHLAAPTDHTRDLIAEIKPSDVPRDIVGAVNAAATELGGSAPTDSTIVLFTDGAWSSDDDAAIVNATRGIPLQCAQVGSSTASNVGIVSLESRIKPFTEGEREVFVRIRNFSAKSITGLLTVTVNRTADTTRPISIAPGGFQSVTLDLPSIQQGGVLTASLTGLSGDNLASDNSASLVLQPAASEHVLLVTTGSLYLEKALSADPSIALYECAPSGYADASSSPFAVTIFDDWLPNQMPPNAALVFHATGDGLPVAANGGDVVDPSVVDWSQTHPIMRFVDFSQVHVSKAAQAVVEPWGTTLVDADSGPMVVAGERDDRRTVWVSFSPQDSDFPLKVSFPVFLANTLEWLSTAPNESGSISPGTPIFIPTGAGQWQIENPNKSASGLCEQNNIGCVYSGTTLAGIYTVRADRIDRTVAVNVTSEVESSIVPKDHSALTVPRPIPASDRPLTGARPLWSLAAILALTIVLLEWTAYHRRR